MREITMVDIAHLAGVSVSTVSRVINKNYPVSPKVCAKVERVMAEQNYRPNGLARNLRSNKSHSVAFIVPEIANLFFMRIAQQFEKELSQLGYSCVFASSERDAMKEQELIETFLHRRIDGLVIATVDPTGRNVERCIEAKVPVVLFDRDVSRLQCSKVLWNNVDGCRQLAEHLIERGHRKIGILNGLLEHESNVGRLRGCQKALRGAGISEQETYISPSIASSKEAAAYTTELLSLPDPPTALFCTNEVILNGTVDVLMAKKILFPETISVVAFGSCECNRFISTKITTCEQDCIEMGRQAARLLQVSMESGEKTILVLETQLVERMSTKEYQV